MAKEKDSYGEQYQVSMGPGDKGSRLDKALHEHLPGFSRSFLKALIKQKHVLVDGRPAKPSYLIEGTESILVNVPRPKEENGKCLEEMDIPVVFDDDWIVVIDKPAGIAVHPNAAFKCNTIAQWAEWKYGKLPTPDNNPRRSGIVHRLDRETSGIMVLAKKAESMAYLKEQFKKRLTRKEYLALVYGVPEFISDAIESPIGKDPENPERMRVMEDGGRESTTYYEVLEDLGNWALCRCLPKTGRTHQIRVHMASIGHSLIGDKIYRSPNTMKYPLPDSAPELQRHALHALSLTIIHPKTREPVTFEAQPPQDFMDLLQWLRQRKG